MSICNDPIIVMFSSHIESFNEHPFHHGYSNEQLDLDMHNFSIEEDFFCMDGVCAVFNCSSFSKVYSVLPEIRLK